MPIIEANNLTKTFTYYEKETGLRNSFKNLFKRNELSKEAVKGVSFSIDEGEIVGFLGPNGAGKTTTLKMLSGILYPSEGTASVMGFIPWQRKKQYKMNFSIVMGQKSQLWWDLPANESLLLSKYIYEIPDKDYQSSLSEMSELLDVADLLKVQVRRLSLGERMKLELIAALIHRPKVMFLDEPTIGLDIISQKKIRDFLKYYNQQKKTTIILTSHYMNDIEDLCKRSIIINQGIVVYDGQLNKVNSVFMDRKLIHLQFSEFVEQACLIDYGTIREYSGYNVLLEVNKNGIKQTLKAILDRFPVFDFTIEDISIEEGIAKLYKMDGDVPS
ncbi:ABC-2 type transport system ATP-binding protein [Paenibacillus sp. cl6col]|uniref:ATP-binding cassette domain-containing protein n=1 Tax=Paenibacillus alvei TaxID=44250 RepID=A0ABT4E9F1_PAEAL|nr:MULTISPECIES: ATP-binding cassette domain-containing protein [Paenibacillus]MCY9530245.1 ATP-binding cassette domain-containing protein [Paenibacillus alvei]SDF67134.1 ABC-2 type transport system ATP-binding protein [Paenibacillus sp. cl6col]